MDFTFDAEVWIWPGKGQWHFVSLPPDQADEIEARYGGTAAGFGSIKVQVQLGLSQRSTSIFPSSQQKTYVLPLKKPVRQARGISAGDTVSVMLSIDDPA